jgi:hypothetical protein
VTTTRRTSRRPITFDPDEVEFGLLSELEEWLSSFPVANRRTLRPILEDEVRRRLRRHARTWSDDGRRWVPIRPTREPLHPAQLTRAIVGVHHYRFPTAVGLAWAVSGVEPDVANRWAQDRRPWRPTCRDEEGVSRFDALDRARAWQEHLAPETLDPRRPWLLDPEVLVHGEAVLAGPLRDPGSLQPYLRAGFSETAALSWHRLLSEQKLVGRDRATLPTALAWRQAGVGLPALYRWSAKGPTPKFGPRYPITWQAAFLHAGCPNLQTALPWLDLVRQRRRFTLQDAVLLYRTTPIDWVRAWA